MGNKKLVFCCIAGILLGFLAPKVFAVALSTSLSVGMVLGLAVGYFLDMLDEKAGRNAGAAALSQKARKANQLMEQARAELAGKPALPEEIASDEEEVQEEERSSDDQLEEEAAKLSEAEEMIRKARERIR